MVPDRRAEDDRQDWRGELYAREVRALEELSKLVRPVRNLASLFRIIAISAATGLVIATLGDVVMIIFAAALVAVLLRGAGERLGRVLHVGTGWGVLAVIVGVIAFLGGLVWWHGQSLAEQFGQLQEGLAQQFENLREQLQQTDWGQRVLHQLPFGLGTETSATSQAGAQGGTAASLRSLAGLVAGALWSALGLLGTIGVILVAALYIAAAPQSYVNGLLELLPSRQRAPTRRVLDHVGGTLWGWLVGQFLDMIVVGVLCGVGLVLLGMPLAFVLALIAGLLNFVPYIGAIAGAIPAVLIALSVSGEEALFVGLLYLGVQTFEGNVTAPLIQKRTIDLPPALTILSQTAFGVIFGLFGVILATPVAAALLAAVQQLRAEKAAPAD
ncbi:MAG TPA: AI-2E family transporter [Acetobacteraceae bacterium]|nr:AI-2E family transporter [Acetobacteraceae bacterium]